MVTMHFITENNRNTYNAETASGAVFGSSLPEAKNSTEIKLGFFYIQIIETIAKSSVILFPNQFLNAISRKQICK